MDHRSQAPSEKPAGKGEIMKKWLFLIIYAIAIGHASAAQRMDMKGTKIHGNQELPKVLYIVPWQDAKAPNLSQPPLKSLINEALTPVDREVFQRKIRYYDALSAQKKRSNAN